MKLNKISLISLFILLLTSPSFADISVPYGEGSGKVDYTNFNKFPKLEKQEEPTEEQEIEQENAQESDEIDEIEQGSEESEQEAEPDDQSDDQITSGPLSFRIVGDKTWVADSVGGKMMQFDNKGKLISEFSVLPNGVKPYQVDEEGEPLPNILIDDMAPVLGQYGDIEAWWIADSINNMLVKFSVDGKPLAQLQDPDHSQLFRVEVGAGGHLFVADKGTNNIYVYDSNGNILSEQNWEGSGMAVAGINANLYRLIYFNEEKRYMLVTTDVKGKVIKSKVLDVEMVDPVLWWVDEAKEEAVITYTPLTSSDENLEKEEIEDINAAQQNLPKSFYEEYEIISVGFDGKVKAKGKLSAPYLVNRFIDSNYEDVYVVKCNYFEAPKGNFEIVPFSFPK